MYHDIANLITNSPYSRPTFIIKSQRTRAIAMWNGWLNLKIPAGIATPATLYYIPMKFQFIDGEKGIHLLHVISVFC